MGMFMSGDHVTGLNLSEELDVGVMLARDSTSDGDAHSFFSPEKSGTLARRKPANFHKQDVCFSFFSSHQIIFVFFFFFFFFFF
jgi:hypothetical protein